MDNEWRKISGVLQRFSVTASEISLTTDEGSWRFVATGDCCAHAYIHEPDTAREDLVRLVADKIVHAGVSNARRIPSEEDDCRDINFYTLSTATDTAVITLYTDHNGYYCGWLELCP